MVNVQYTKNSIGIPRNQLPQIDFKTFDTVKNDLENVGIEYACGSIKCNKLKPQQLDLNQDKITKMIDDKVYDEPRTIFVSKEGYIVDGHHGWAAKLEHDQDSTIDVIAVNMCIIDLINWFNSRDDSYQIEIYEQKGKL